MAYLANEKVFLEGTLASRQKEFDKLNQYETERVGLQKVSRDSLLLSVSQSLESFQAFRGELKKLKEFLIAQASAEFKYADCLEAQYQTYCPTTGTDENDLTRKRATTTEIMSKTLEYLHVKDDITALPSPNQDNSAVAANVKKASFQFFTGFSDFNRSSANQFRDFGNFILQSVVVDVEVLVVEVDEGM